MNVFSQLSYLRPSQDIKKYTQEESKKEKKKPKKAEKVLIPETKSHKKKDERKAEFEIKSNEQDNSKKPNQKQNNIPRLLSQLTNDILKGSQRSKASCRENNDKNYLFRPIKKRISSEEVINQKEKKKFVFRRMWNRLLKIQKKGFKEVKEIIYIRNKLMVKDFVKSKKKNILLSSVSVSELDSYYQKFIIGILKHEKYKNHFNNGYLEEFSLDEPLMKISLALGVRLNHKKQRPNDYFFDLDQQNSPIRKQKAIKKQNIFKAKKRCQIEENPDDYCKLHPYDLEDMTKFLTKINNGIDTKEKLISQIIQQNQKLLNEERELQMKLKELEKKRIRKDCHTQTEKSRNK